MAIPDIRIALPDEDPPDPVRRIAGEGIPVVGQGPGNLGERLARVTAREFDRGATLVAVLGADHPDLPAGLLRRCLEAARAGRAGWIRTTDGGFAALALPRPAPDLFPGVPWSTPGVAEAVRTNAVHAGIELVECGRWHDVDTPDDLDRLARRLAGCEDGCAATRAALDALDPPWEERTRRAPFPGGDS